MDFAYKANIDNKLTLFFHVLLVLLPASFPFYHSISAVITIILLLVWVLLCYYRNIYKALKNKFVFIFIVGYLISFISVLYSQNKADGLFSVQKQLSLLIFPLILYTIKLNKKIVRYILYSFSCGCLIVAISSFLYAIYKNYKENALNSIIPELFATNMSSELFDISHVYFGMYVSFTIIILSFTLVSRVKHSSISIFIVLLIGFLLFFLFLLGGKMSIISLSLLAFIVCIFFIFQSKRWFFGILFFVVPIGVFIITMNNSQYAKKRFLALFDSSNYEVGDNSWNSIASRVSILKCTNEIFKKDPIVGIGIGDIRDKLDECNEGLMFHSLKGMNPHNQYLQYLLGTGLIGLIVFMISFIYPFVIAYFEVNKLYLCFIFIFSFCCLTESMLERQYGVMFYSFFNSLLFFHFIPEHEKS